MSRERSPRRASKRFHTGIGLWVVALVLLPGAVFAQENGIRVGEGRVHPYFDLEFAIDSAAGFFPGAGAAASTLSPEALFHFRPGLRLELPSSTVNLNLDGDFDYVYYTGLLSPGSQQASHPEAQVTGEADFNKSGAVEFDIGDTFSRLDRTTNVAIGVGVLSLYNQAHVAVPIHPGGGALEVTPSGAFSLENYTTLTGGNVPGCNDINCQLSAVQAMNYLDYQAGLNARWKFLPKTAVVLENTFDARTYPDPSQSAANSLLLKSELGLVGLITPKIAAIAKVGWGQDFAASGAHTVIAHAELNYLMSDTSSIKGGYLRDLAPVPTYGTYGDDRGYLEARFFLGGRLTLHAYGAFDFLSFYSIPALAPPGRSDVVFTVDAGPEYQFNRWLIGALGYTLNSRGSNISTASSVNFTRNVGYVRLTLTY